MGILIKVIYTTSIKGRRAALNSMNDISFVEKKFCEIGAVLPRNPSDECGLAHLNVNFSDTVGFMHALYST